MTPPAARLASGTAGTTTRFDDEPRGRMDRARRDLRLMVDADRRRLDGGWLIRVGDDAIRLVFE